MVKLAGTYLQSFGGGGIAPIVMMVSIFAIFYFLLIMPQQRKQKKWQEMLKQIKPGDRVITSGGLTGIILSVKDKDDKEDVVILRVPPDNIKLAVARSSIVTLTTQEEHKS
jgi:preprotein translocase subunit YajC